MKTYLIIITSLIVAIFATTAGASPQHGDRQQGHKRDQRQEHRQDHAQAHRQDRHQDHQSKKHSGGHDHRDNHRVASHHHKHHQNKQHTTHVREVHREVVTYYPQRVVRPRTDVSWNINVGWTPAYPNHGHGIYYQRRANGQCFRVEERVDRTVWIEVPYYKCP